MVKYIHIIAVILYAAATFGQPCFPDSNAIWNVNTFYESGNPKSEILYGLKGDTLINDTLYHKLYLLSDTILESNNLEEYIGCFRHDTQRVWFRPEHGDITEFLLYDFSVDEGDTIWHNASLTISYNNGSPVLIFGHDPDYISYVKDRNEYEKFLTLYLETGIYDKQFEHFLWSVEHECLYSIGSTIGLFWQHYEPPIGYGNTIKNLACFKQNDTVKYTDNAICDKCFCDLYGSIDEKSKNLDGIKVFPNPADNSLIIKIDRPYNNIRAELIDEKGSIVYSDESVKNTINVNNISKGIYFLNLTIDNEKITKKVIIE